MDVLDRAQNFNGGPIAAARQRDRWARQEANATDPEKREALREAVADLEARYPDLEEVPIGGAEAFARERGHGSGARSPVHQGRHRMGARKTTRSSSAPRGKAATSKKPAAKEKSGPPGLDPTARRAKRPKRTPRSAPTPRVDRAIRQTGIPSAFSSSGSTLMAGLGATVGLAMLFLLVSSAEQPGSGAAAFPQLITSITRALGRFLSLEDVFPAGTSAPSSSTAQTALTAPHAGPVTGAKPVRVKAPRRQVQQVLNESGRFPGEAGAGGGGQTLSNPGAELRPRPNPHNRRRRREPHH